MASVSMAEAARKLYHCYACQNETTATYDTSSEEYSCDSCGGSFVEEIGQDEHDEDLEIDSSDDEMYDSTAPMEFMNFLNSMQRQSEMDDDDEMSSDEDFGDDHDDHESIGARGGVGSISMEFVVHGPGPVGLRELFRHSTGVAGTSSIRGNPGNYVFGNQFEDILSSLFNRAASRGPPPASAAAVQSLPVVKITKPNLECVVCKDEFTVGMECLQLPCKHNFHPDCIKPWLERSNTCPTCRYELPTDQTTS